jgi:hypothetical protein
MSSEQYGNQFVDLDYTPAEYLIVMSISLMDMVLMNLPLDYSKLNLLDHFLPSLTLTSQ